MLVGPDINTITQTYVILNETYYTIETPFKAIDIAFKCMHALDIKYPVECAREWLFLQQAVYDISTNKKNIGDIKVWTLIEEYLKFKNNS